MCGIINVFLTTCIRKNKMAIRKGNPGIGNMKEMMDQVKAGTMVFEDGMFKPAPVKAKKAGGMMKKGYAKGKMVKKMMAGGKTKKMMSAGGELKMVKGKDGKQVPFYAADGVGKMKAGGMTKKSYAQGKMVKKGMAAGGKAKGKAKGGKSKVRGAGIARKGVRAAKMR